MFSRISKFQLITQMICIENLKTVQTVKLSNNFDKQNTDDFKAAQRGMKKRVLARASGRQDKPMSLQPMKLG